MSWNFIGRRHDDIVEAARAWQDAFDRFGTVPGYARGRLPGPALTRVRLTPRADPRP
ncbi:hypothetical protein ABZ383_25865 [Streptomyces sp. NPDC005900]|uniref:hypothetical protein n=1 Tax=unclassified Streptomyces TaxID=2593676 RepID=UPI0033CE2789